MTMKLTSSPLRNSLDHDGLTGAAEMPRACRRPASMAASWVLADEDALAGRESVGLDDHGQALRSI